MVDRTGMSPTARTALALCCLLAAGCAAVKHAGPTEPVPSIPPATSSPVLGSREEIAPEAAPAAAEAPTPRATPAPAPATQPERPAQSAPAPRAAVSKAPATALPATPVAPARPPPKPPPKAAAVVAAAPAAAPQVVPKAATAAAAPQPSAAPLDLKSLEARLRQTRAIGVLTKLSLKNQVDDLVGRFRAYHQQRGTGTLADLRRNYDMLLLKVLSLLQDSDPALARDIVKSRAAIWEILADPKKFNDPSLMAGATQ